MSNLLHLRVVGKGVPLVLLHGWGFHSGIWVDLVPHLVDQFELFMPDLPGFGKSPIFSKEYSLESIGNALLEQVPSNAIWLGWSLGGLVAWWVAIHYPEKVSRLITIAASPKFVSDKDWAGVPLSLLEKFDDNLKQNYRQTVQDFLTLQLRGHARYQELLSKLQEQFVNPDPVAVEGGLELLRTTDFRRALRGLSMPSLHIFGSLDTIVPISIVDHLQNLISHGQCEIIKRAGHIPFLSQQKKFLECLQKFLLNLDRA
ncbi:MAG: bioH [Gammaproteobacteria bacterium]|nr:bioH [Gammaproteobacteria bacterium]